MRKAVVSIALFSLIFCAGVPDLKGQNAGSQAGGTWKQARDAFAAGDYLTVPVFYSDHNAQMPRALWGVAQSYAKLKDAGNQEKTLQELVAKYPDAPEASLAKAELMKKENKT